LTSRPYPIECIEALSFDPEFAQIQNLLVTEALDFTPAFVSGNVHNLVLSHTQPPEAVEFEPEFISGSLHKVIERYAIPPEAVEFSSGFVFGVLSSGKPPITYVIPPEALDMTPSFVSGSVNES
jgi:hypothetical protein